MIVDADKVKELKNLAVAFALLELPGQPRAMHMGTSYLVNQLMSAVESQAAEIERLKEDAERLNWVVETGYRVVLIEEPAIGWCVIIPPITYLTKGHTTMRAAIDSAKGKQ